MSAHAQQPSSLYFVASVTLSPLVDSFHLARDVALPGLVWRSGAILPLMTRLESRKLQREAPPLFCDSDRGQDLAHCLESPGTPPHSQPANTPSSGPNARPRPRWRAAQVQAFPIVMADFRCKLYGTWMPNIWPSITLGVFCESVFG